MKTKRLPREIAEIMDEALAIWREVFATRRGKLDGGIEMAAIEYTLTILCGCGGEHDSHEEWQKCPMALVPKQNRNYFEDRLTIAEIAHEACKIGTSA